VERRDGNAAEVLERVCGDSEVEDGLVKDWWGKRFLELDGWRKIGKKLLARAACVLGMGKC
jgi:hypothetical protein